MTKEQRFNLMMGDEELAMLRALSTADGESAASVLRRLVRREYVARFGEKKPRFKGPRVITIRAGEQQKDK